MIKIIEEANILFKTANLKEGVLKKTGYNRWEIMTAGMICKSRTTVRQSNMPSYEREVAGFTWGDARTLLDWFPDGKLNIAYEAIDRHLYKGNGDKIALRWLSKNGSRKDFTYRDLSLQSNRFANLLRSLGIEKGDRVYSLLGRVPELYSSS